MGTGTAALSIVYIVVLVGYGLYKGGKAKNFQEFTGMAAEPPLLIMTASMCASFIGGGFSLGNASRAFESGIANTILLFGFSAGQLLVGLFLAPKFSAVKNTSTVGGIIAEASGGTAPRLLCGLLSAIFCAGVLGAQIHALGSVAGYLFSLPPKLCSFIGFAVIVFYSTFGGLRASLKSDALQIMVLGVGLPLALWAALTAGGGLTGLFAALPAGHLSPLGGYNPVGFISALLTFAVGEMLCPPAVQRLLLSKNPRRIRGATVLSGLVSAPFFVVTGIIGLCALAFNTTSDSAVAMPSLIGSALGFPLNAIVCGAMLCVYLSSGGSFLNSCASALCEDVLKVLRPGLDGNRQLFAARVINVMCGCVAFVTAVSFDDVLNILIMSYSFWAPMMLVPLIWALNGRRFSVAVFMSSSAIAAASLLIWRLAGEPFDISPILVGLAADILAFAVLNRKKKAEKLKS